MLASAFADSIDVLLKGHALEQFLFCDRETIALKQLASQLPPILRGGFECRLSADDSQVDLQQCIQCDEKELDSVNKIIEKALSASKAADSPKDYVAWLRLQDFNAEWSKPDSFLRSHIIEIWLEFDIELNANAPQPSLPLPSIFFGLPQSSLPASEAYRIAEKSLDLLMGRSAWKPWQNNLRRCFETCSGDVFISHIGVMLSRNSPALRVNIRRLQPNSLATYLRQILWPGAIDSIEELANQLFDWVDRITLCLDVGERILPKIGLECTLLKQPQADACWSTFLDGLVALKICEPKKRQALLDWPRQIHPLNASIPWPKDLVVASLLQPADRFAIFDCRISHIKVSWQANHPLEAKAYLWFQHRYLSLGVS